MAKFDVNEDMVRKLAGLLDETGLTEIEYKVGEQAVRVSRNSTGQLVTAAPTTNIQTDDVPQINSEIRAGSVTAPMVGVVYLSPEPGTPAFIKEGDMVTEGQTLMLIEAMKTFNHVRAPKAGRVAEICVSDQSPVEFGEDLVIIE